MSESESQQPIQAGTEIVEQAMAELAPKPVGVFMAPVLNANAGTNLNLTDAKALAEKLGAVAVPREVISVLANAGMEVERRGIVQVADGCAIITLQTLLQAILAVSEDCNDAKKRDKSAKTLGYLAKVIHSFHSTMKATAPPTVVNVTKPGGRAFPAGTKITQVNHYHGVQSDKPK